MLVLGLYTLDSWIMFWVLDLALLIFCRLDFTLGKFGYCGRKEIFLLEIGQEIWLAQVIAEVSLRDQ
jgi:hypothetical protein